MLVADVLCLIVTGRKISYQELSSTRCLQCIKSFRNKIPGCDRGLLYV